MHWPPPVGEFVSVGVGAYSACGVRTDGEVECWGLRDPVYCSELATCHGWDGGYGEFAPEGPFTSISVAKGLDFDSSPTICAVREDGGIVCWNDGTETFRPPVGEFAAVDVSRWLTCGLRAGGEAACWGSMHPVYGLPAPEWSSPGGRFVSVSAGGAHACGLRPTGGVACWGFDVHGETRAPPGVFTEVSAGLGLSCGLRPDGAAECWGSNRWWEAAPPPGPFTSIRAGEASACGLRPDGSVECWGRDHRGAPSPDGEFAALAAGGGACGLRHGGEIECWGPTWEVAGRLPAGPFSALSALGRSGCGLGRDGSAACWGYAAPAPTGTFATVSAGDDRACGIRPSGELECWGRIWPPGAGRPEREQPPGDAVAADRSEIVAYADWYSSLEPTGLHPALRWLADEAPQGPFTQIESGSASVCGLRPVDMNAPAEPPRRQGHRHGGVGGHWAGGRGVHHGDRRGGLLGVAAGDGATCGLRPWRSVECWGDHRTVPPRGEFVALSAGRSGFCGLRADATIDCWGV